MDITPDMVPNSHEAAIRDFIESSIIHAQDREDDEEIAALEGVVRYVCDADEWLDEKLGPFRPPHPPFDSDAVGTAKILVGIDLLLGRSHTKRDHAEMDAWLRARKYLIPMLYEIAMDVEYEDEDCFAKAIERLSPAEQIAFYIRCEKLAAGFLARVRTMKAALIRRKEDEQGG